MSTPEMPWPSRIPGAGPLPFRYDSADAMSLLDTAIKDIMATLYGARLRGGNTQLRAAWPSLKPFSEQCRAKRHRH